MHRNPDPQWSERRIAKISRSMRTLSVTVTTDVSKTVENAFITGLVMGEIPVPIAVDALVKERLSAQLTELGYVVCNAPPCGEGEMNVRLTQAAVGTEFTGSSLRSHSRITALVKVKQHDGQEPYDFTFWDRRSGSVEEAPLLVRNSALRGKHAVIGVRRWARTSRRPRRLASRCTSTQWKPRVAWRRRRRYPFRFRAEPLGFLRSRSGRGREQNGSCPESRSSLATDRRTTPAVACAISRGGWGARREY